MVTLQGVSVARRWRLTLVVSLVAVLSVLPAGPAGAATPSAAVSEAAAYSAARAVESYISVVDRQSGEVLAQTGNAQSQVASESIMKLLLAAYYIVQYGGYQRTPADVLSRLSYMLRLSDNAITSSLFTAAAIPTIAARYGLGRTTNATDRTGHWGAARITAGDMTRVLYRASKDAAVGPWLIPVMAQTSPSGSDGFNQAFGLNALSGTHGSKQGWGCDSFWTARACAIHSVGYTDSKFVAVLQLSNSYPDPARGTATHSAQLIQASTIRANPVGALDVVRNPARNVLTVAGWAADPEAPGRREEVHVYVTAPGQRHGFAGIFTGGARPDVQRRYPWAGGATGYSARIAPVAAGANKVCAYAINVNPPPVSPVIGCRTVQVRNAFGHLDLVVTRSRTITVRGWALNPNNRAERVTMHLYDITAAGHKITIATANGARPDVARLYPQYDGNHGFNAVLGGVAPGQHRLCAYAITTGGGISNSLLGCRSVTVPA